jgi:hypothetical protein
VRKDSNLPLNSYTTMALFTEASSKKSNRENTRKTCRSDTDMACKFGLMERATKGVGEMIRQKERARSGTLMGTCTREISVRTRAMDMECIYVKMALNSRDNGKTIYSMAKALQNG